MLSASRLRILSEVARRGSFSAAAQALSYTQSAVSQQIAALETQTGVKLLERHARGVRLTAAGQTLVRHAEACGPASSTSRCCSTSPARPPLKTA